ncbi:hypothetical protein NE237_015551 [Protea cynaroides]|uniref:Uncharacterized protein n=1 Tax=Protea cynaroides TaxID=273540 RepID=A0A9Q0QR65_9MAGN|nr:hypothetical protein NE237_015551 [Protea cynaroides]
MPLFATYVLYRPCLGGKTGDNEAFGTAKVSTKLDEERGRVGRGIEEMLISICLWWRGFRADGGQHLLLLLWWVNGGTGWEDDGGESGRRSSDSWRREGGCSRLDKLKPIPVTADDWETQGGMVKTNWTHAPFVASYKSFDNNSYECPFCVTVDDNVKRCSAGDKGCIN